jgi:hypothetical protein
MVGLPGRSDMAQRCQLSRDGALAAAFASLGRLASQPASFQHDNLRDGPVAVASAFLFPFGVSRVPVLRLMPT